MVWSTRRGRRCITLQEIATFSYLMDVVDTAFISIVNCRIYSIHINSIQLFAPFSTFFFVCLLNISIQFASNYQFIRWINPRKSRWMKSPKKGGGAEGGASWFFFLVVVASVGTLRASGPISVGFLVFFSACHPLWNTQQPPTIQPQEAATGAGIKTHISY